MSIYRAWKQKKIVENSSPHQANSIFFLLLFTLESYPFEVNRLDCIIAVLSSGYSPVPVIVFVYEPLGKDKVWVWQKNSWLRHYLHKGAGNIWTKEKKKFCHSQCQAQGITRLKFMIWALDSSKVVDSGLGSA